LWGKYGTRIDSNSAREILAARVEKPAPSQAAVADSEASVSAPEPRHKEAADAASGGIAKLGSFLQSRQGKQLQGQVVRGVFGLLKKSL
jgi:hypothetical protein